MDLLEGLASGKTFPSDWHEARCKFASILILIFILTGRHIKVEYRERRRSDGDSDKEVGVQLSFKDSGSKTFLRSVLFRVLWCLVKTTGHCWCTSLKCTCFC